MKQTYNNKECKTCSKYNTATNLCYNNKDHLIKVAKDCFCIEYNKRFIKRNKSITIKVKGTTISYESLLKIIDEVEQNRSKV